MGTVGGIATGESAPVGDRYRPEAAGIFVCRNEGEVEWFLTFGQHPLMDVWEVDAQDLPIDELPDGALICHQRIPPSRLRLVRRDVPPQVSSLPAITTDKELSPGELGIRSGVVYRNHKSG